jgi:diguanylate cyclase
LGSNIKQKVFSDRFLFNIISLAIWVAIISGLFVFFGHHEIDKSQHKYQDLHDEFYRRVSVAQKTYEVSIESFASFLSAGTDSGFKNARIFAQNLRMNYPDIYMLEIAKRVTNDQRGSFEKSMRESGYVGFDIHTFSYETDRKFSRSPVKDFYYPIVFIEPELDVAMGVMGLDLSESSSILKDALERSFDKRTHVASRPFTLVEGKKGYLLYREVGSQQSYTFEAIPRKELYAILVIDVESLVPDWAYNTKGFFFSLRYPGAGKDDHGLLAEKLPKDADNTLLSNSMLFPVFEAESQLESRSQPFILKTSYHTGISDIDFKHLFMFIVLVSATIPFPFWLAGVLYNRKERHHKELKKTLHLANYDSLTGLPNKNLAKELFHQISSIVNRRNKKIAILYIDLNDFKQVNDEYGHQAGDLLLQHVAERLSGTLRDSDTLIRLHGDEFVMFINDLESTKDVDLVVNKINSAFEHSIDINGTHVCISMSIGSAMYPDDGDTLDKLLNASDKNMYKNKRQQKGRVAHLFQDSRW